MPDAPPLDLARVAQRIGSIAREYTELCLKGAPRYSERTSRRKWSCPAGGGPEVPGNLGASHLNRNRRLEKAEYQNYVLLHQHLIVCVSEAKELRDLAARLSRSSVDGEGNSCRRIMPPSWNLGSKT